MANINGDSLFPILSSKESSPTGPKGIARLALDAAQVDRGHEVEFRSLTVRSILNKSISRRGLWFAKSINPYRG
jgi:hypothetical protein